MFEINEIQDLRWRYRFQDTEIEELFENGFIFVIAILIIIIIKSTSEMLTVDLSICNKWVLSVLVHTQDLILNINGYEHKHTAQTRGGIH